MKVTLIQFIGLSVDLWARNKCVCVYNNRRLSVLEDGGQKHVATSRILI
jgi:hypothetical protein